MVYKLLEDSRNEVKLKTEKLLKKLHFLLGQQVIDQCPSSKLQRVIEVVFNSNGQGKVMGNAGSLIAGGGTFGAAGAASLLASSGDHSNSNNAEGKA